MVHVQIFLVNCNCVYTCFTSCAYPSWFISKTGSRFYVTDIVSAVRRTSFITAMSIYSESLTPFNKHFQLQLFISFLMNSITYYFVYVFSVLVLHFEWFLSRKMAFYHGYVPFGPLLELNLNILCLSKKVTHSKKKTR